MGQCNSSRYLQHQEHSLVTISSQQDYHDRNPISKKYEKIQQNNYKFIKEIDEKTKRNLKKAQKLEKKTSESLDKYKINKINEKIDNIKSAEINKKGSDNLISISSNLINNTVSSNFLNTKDGSSNNIESLSKHVHPTLNNNSISTIRKKLKNQINIIEKDQKNVNVIEKQISIQKSGSILTPKSILKKRNTVEEYNKMLSSHLTFNSNKSNNFKQMKSSQEIFFKNNNNTNIIVTGNIKTSKSNSERHTRKLKTYVHTKKVRFRKFSEYVYYRSNV